MLVEGVHHGPRWCAKARIVTATRGLQTGLPLDIPWSSSAPFTRADARDIKGEALGLLVTTMQRDSSQQVQRDLFLTPIIRDTSCPPPPKQVLPAQRPRYFLPKDLRNAVKQLTDGELDRLLAVSIDEAKRRGRLPPGFQANPLSGASRSPSHFRTLIASGDRLYVAADRSMYAFEAIE